MRFEGLKLHYKNNNIKDFVFIFISKILYQLYAPILIFLYFKNLRTKKRIVFCSSPDYSDNSRVLFDYLKNRQNNYEIIWLVDDLSNYISNKDSIKFIRKLGKYNKYLTFKSLYYIYSSEIVFYTHGFNMIVKKSDGNPMMINLWHGCGYKDNNVKGGIQTYQFDYILVPGPLFLGSKSRFFNCPIEKVLDIGYPRYDLFKTNSERANKFINNLIREKSIEKIIIWMPTFRESEQNLADNNIFSGFDLPILSSIEDMKKFNDYCKSFKTLIIIKQHKNQLVYKAKNIIFSNIIFLDNNGLEQRNIQLYELLPLTDALITDYSSVGIDYLLLDKPIGFTLDDYEEYKRTRGFIFENPKEYMPGYYILNLNNLYLFVENLCKGVDTYKEERTRVRKIAHNETDDYCSRIIEYFRIIKS